MLINAYTYTEAGGLTVESGGALLENGLTVHDAGASFSSTLRVTDGITVYDSTDSTIKVTLGLTILSDGISTRDLTVSGGGLMGTGGLSISTTNLYATSSLQVSGGLSIENMLNSATGVTLMNSDLVIGGTGSLHTHTYTHAYTYAYTYTYTYA